MTIPTDARAELNDRIRQIFAGKTFEAVSFPGAASPARDSLLAAQRSR